LVLAHGTVLAEDACNPPIYVVWDIQLSEFVIANCIKGFREIHSYDNYIGVGGEQGGN